MDDHGEKRSAFVHVLFSSAASILDATSTVLCQTGCVTIVDCLHRVDSSQPSPHPHSSLVVSLPTDKCVLPYFSLPADFL